MNIAPQSFVNAVAPFLVAGALAIANHAQADIFIPEQAFGSDLGYSLDIDSVIGSGLLQEGDTIFVWNSFDFFGTDINPNAGFFASDDSIVSGGMAHLRNDKVLDLAYFDQGSITGIDNNPVPPFFRDTTETFFDNSYIIDSFETLGAMHNMTIVVSGPMDLFQRRPGEDLVLSHMFNEVIVPLYDQTEWNANIGSQHVSGQVNLVQIPGPGATALLGIAGLAANRRRRMSPVGPA